MPFLPLALAALPALAASQIGLPPKGYLRLESGLSNLGYNQVEIPNDSSSTRFSLRPLLGADYKAFSRITYESPLGNGARGFRFVAAFLDDAGTGKLRKPAEIDGKPLLAGVRTRALYRFNGYRATYWWRLREDARRLVRIGATLNVRDARVDVRQGNVRGTESNVGPVPLLYLQIDRRLTGRLGATFETDAFAVPGGRAIDANLRLSYALTPIADLLLGSVRSTGWATRGGTSTTRSDTTTSLRSRLPVLR